MKNTTANTATSAGHLETLKLLDRFAQAALPAVMAAATQTKRADGTPHKCGADMFFHEGKPFACANTYAEAAYAIAISMLSVREITAVFLDQIEERVKKDAAELHAASQWSKQANNVFRN